MPKILGICWVASAAASSLGFLNPLHAISYGYGLSMLAQSALTLVLTGRSSDVPATDRVGKAHLALVGLYGARLASFILWRSRLKSYKARRESRKEQDKREVPSSLVSITGLVIGCSGLYSIMFLPAYYSASHPKPENGLTWRDASAIIGLASATLALLLESVADVIQQRHYDNPNTEGPCTTGPWSITMNANYYGEAIFWISGLVAGMRGYTTPMKWVLSTLGVASIVSTVGFEGKRRYARRTGLRQQKDRAKES